MKKNRILRVAAFLLIAVMITTCTISGTFAKYVTADDGSATARVAKWGVDVAVQAGAGADDANDAFATAYGTTVLSNSEYNKNLDNDDATNVDALVAHGTEGTLATVAITGKPEVTADVKVDVDLELEGWTINSSEYYCPLIITVGSTEYKGTNYASMAEFEVAVEEAIIKALTADDQAITDDGTGKTATKQYSPNTSLNKSLTVKWAWTFHVDDATDAKDTALGDLDTASTVSFDIAVDITQVD